MFDKITQVETALLYIICGIVLFISSFSIFIMFLCYKQLRHGIYGMILGSLASEAYLGLHSFLNGVYGLSRHETESINEKYCTTDGMLALFFTTFWSTQNISIIILFTNRKLKDSVLSKILLILSLTISILICVFAFLNDVIGVSYFGTCFITKTNDFIIYILFGLYLILFLFAIIFNFWFFLCRDTSKDRNFINGYNYFILISSALWSFQVINLVLICLFDIEIKTLNILSIIITKLCYLYVSISRWQIEHIQILLHQGPSNSKLLNCILFLFGCSQKPKFKDIKKVLNVKLIEMGDNNDTIYSHIKV